MRPPEDVDAGGASARVGDADDPRLRERARGIIRRADEEYEELIAECFCGECTPSGAFIANSDRS